MHRDTDSLEQFTTSFLLHTGVINSIMLLKLPPELLLLIVDQLGYKSHLRLATTCKTLWELLGSIAKLRSRYAVFRIYAPDNDHTMSKASEWQEAYVFIETLKVLVTSAFWGNPNPLFWVGKTNKDIGEARCLYPDSENSSDRKLKPSKLVNLRAIELPTICHDWIPLINAWSEILNTESPLNTLAILKISGEYFGFHELMDIFKLPTLRHLCIWGPRASWDDGFENLGSSIEPRSSSIEALEILDSSMSVGSASYLIAACRALKCFAYWHKSVTPRYLTDVWDSRAVIYALCEHHSQSIKVLSLQAESVDMYRVPWIPLKKLSQLESLTSNWLYFMPDYAELPDRYRRPSRENPIKTYHLNPIPLSEVLPSSLKSLYLKQKSTKTGRKHDTPWDIRMLNLKEYLESPYSALDQIYLPFHSPMVKNAAETQGVRYEVAPKCVDAKTYAGSFAYQDSDGDWISVLDP